MNGLLSPAEEYAIAIGAKCTLPSKSLAQGAPYVRSESTDLWATFERLWAETADFDAKNPYHPRSKK
jgi:hypothetical protein